MGQWKTEIVKVNGIEICKYESEHTTGNLQRVIDFLSDNLELKKTINHRHTSYGYKHMLEDYFKVSEPNNKYNYVSNHDFKVAMATLGIKGVNPDKSINYCYPISEKWVENLAKETERLKAENINK